MFFEQGMAARGFQVFADHFCAHLFGGDFGHPAQFFLGLGGIPQQGFNFGRAEIAWITPISNCITAI